TRSLYIPSVHRSSAKYPGSFLSCADADPQEITQDGKRLTNYPRVARSSQPWAERFPSFQDGGSQDTPSDGESLTNYPKVARSSQPWAERFPSFQDGVVVPRYALRWREGCAKTP